MERDLAKILTLLVIGAILVDVATHGSVFVDLGNIIRKLWLGSLSIVAGGSGNVP